MNLKIQCACGSKYAFEVEPVDGRMPFVVNCPTCGADGTESANELIAQSIASAPRAAVRVAAPVAAAAAPSHAETQENRRAVEEHLRKKKLAQERGYRAGVWIVVAVVVAALGFGGFWGWYWLSGSKPKMIFTTTFGAQDEPTAEFIAPDQFILADSQRAILHDLKADKDVWRASYTTTGGGRKPEILVHGDSIWVCVGSAVIQLDKATGAVKNTTSIGGEFQSFTPTDKSILVVSEIDTITRRAMRIDLATGLASSQDVTVPRSEKHLMPNELPPNVAPTPNVLLTQALDERKFGKAIDAMSSQFFSGGENLVEFRVKLIEPKVTWVDSIKPKGPTLLNGSTTASTSAFGVADEVFNDLKRSQTGGKKAIDESRYEVKVRRFMGDPPVEWTGEVSGSPTFFPLKTVDLVTGGKTLIVLDKQNQRLFQASLSYPVSGRYTKDADEGGEPGAVPAVEGPGGLYFFDQGVLTAFSLPDGGVRWRLTTVGVSKLVFDSQDMLYVATTTAAPEDIQYSDQIRFDSVKPVLLKVDPKSGRILWQLEDAGDDCFVSGKYLYATASGQMGVSLALALGNALGSAQSHGTHFHVYRIDPQTGKPLWSLYNKGETPQDISFQDNKFVLRYDHDVQAWRFISF